MNLPIVAAALLLGRRLVPTSRDDGAGRADPVGIITSISTITLLVWTVIEAPHVGWTAPRTVGGFALSGVLLVAFVRYEARRDHPMLDVSVFRNARFSAASLAVATAFFGLFGFIFLVTQYFQVVRGYDTLATGVHTLPFAVTAAVVSPLSARLALRVGTKRVVGVGLASMSLGFLWASFDVRDTSYWGAIVPQMVLMAAGLALTTAPATESIMGSLPRAKAGVGSAVNDTTRELGGTLGVAVVGSAFSSVYGPKVADALTRIGVPEEPVRIAESSVVAAVQVAERAPEFARPLILEAASDAFLQGMALGCRVAAVATALGSFAAFVFLPARAAGPEGGADGPGDDAGYGDLDLRDAGARPVGSGDTPAGSVALRCERA